MSQEQITQYFQVPKKARLGEIPLKPIHNPLQSAVSIVSSTTPLSIAKKVRGSAAAAAGVGQWNGNPNGVMPVALAATVVILFGALSYQTGKAMAPNNAKAKKWGWIGVPVGMLTGPLGLGIMGFVSNTKQNR